METQPTSNSLPNVEVNARKSEMIESNDIPKNGSTTKEDPMEVDVRSIVSENRPQSIYNGVSLEANGSPHPSLQSNPLLGM